MPLGMGVTGVKALPDSAMPELGLNVQLAPVGL